jgi:DHA1 family tetracycline resistance protein-like MFS transporter
MFKLLKGPIGFIAITAFLTIMGFTIVIPVLPFIIGKYVGSGAIGLWVGIIVALYALCQFFAAPVLGAVSDRIGRKPVLIFCLAGSALGYIIFGIGGALWVLILGRVIDGLTGGDISSMFAYVADRTEPQDRGKAFGLLGGAAGIGGLAGPVIGGLLGAVSLTAPLFVAAGVVTLSVLWGVFYLPESLAVEKRSSHFDTKHVNPLAPFKQVLASRKLIVLFLTSFLFFCAGAMMQANISVFLKDILAFGPGRIGIAVSVLAIVDIFAQGYLSGRLMTIFGEKRVAELGLIINATGFFILAALAFVPSIILLFIALVVFNIGDGLYQPSSNGIISNAAPEGMQGQVQGASQGTQSVGRVIGPLVAASVYALGASLPYFIGGSLVVVGFFVLLILLGKSQQAELRKI